MRNSYIKPGSPCDLKHVTTLKRRLDFILNNLKISQGSHVLDVGSGLGIYMNYLSQLYPNANFIGVDISQEYTAQARKLVSGKNVDFIVMSAENLAFKANMFQVVLMIEVLEHISNPKKAITEVLRVLVPGGKLVITAPNKFFPFETHGFRTGTVNWGTKGLGFPLLPYLPEALRRYIANAKVYTPRTFTKILVESGFQINTIDFLGPNFDQLRIYFPKIEKMSDLIERLIIKMERLPIKNIFPTIIICAEKVIE